MDCRAHTFVTGTHNPWRSHGCYRTNNSSLFPAACPFNWPFFLRLIFHQIYHFRIEEQRRGWEERDLGVGQFIFHQIGLLMSSSTMPCCHMWRYCFCDRFSAAHSIQLHRHPQTLTCIANIHSNCNIKMLNVSTQYTLQMHPTARRWTFLWRLSQLWFYVLACFQWCKPCWPLLPGSDGGERAGVGQCWGAATLQHPHICPLSAICLGKAIFTQIHSLHWAS